MSGGSFDNVYTKLVLGGVADVAAGRYQLARMADAMAEEGYPEAAAPLAAIVARIDALDAWATGLAADGVAELCKSFEWWKSMDSSREDFEADLDKYLEGRAR